MLKPADRPAGNVVDVEGGDETGFPYGSGAAHTASVPFARALGAQWLGVDSTAAAPALPWPGTRMRLPCSPSVCDQIGAIDLRAIVALLDHAGGSQLYAAHLADGATATLELRADIVGRPRPGCDVVLVTRALDRAGRSVLVQGEAAHDDEKLPLVRLTGRYVSGFGPGRATDRRGAAAGRYKDAALQAAGPVPSAASFDDLLGVAGLSLAGSAFELPFEPWRVGAVALPALHGGVVAAALLHAAQAAVPAAREGQAGFRPVSLTVQFLRAALAEPTKFEAICAKDGASAAYLTAVAHQQGGARVVATAQLLFA